MRDGAAAHDRLGPAAPYVPKVRVPVQLSRRQHEPRDGWFMLYPRKEGDGPPESIIELLNSNRIVIPFIRADDASVVLLTRANIDRVTVGTGVAPHLVFPSGHRVTREQRVELQFMDDIRVEGIIQWDASDEHPRLSDFLESSGDFLVLKSQATTLIVNRRRIRETRVAESTPRPANPAAPTA